VNHEFRPWLCSEAQPKSGLLGRPNCTCSYFLDTHFPSRLRLLQTRPLTKGSGVSNQSGDARRIASPISRTPMTSSTCVTGLRGRGRASRGSRSAAGPAQHGLLSRVAYRTRSHDGGEKELGWCGDWDPWQQSSSRGGLSRRGRAFRCSDPWLRKAVMFAFSEFVMRLDQHWQVMLEQALALAVILGVGDDPCGARRWRRIGTALNASGAGLQKQEARGKRQGFRRTLAPSR
jgi:hypothetical protein